MTVRNVFAERSVCLDKPTRTSLFSIAKKMALIFTPYDEGYGSFDVVHAEHDETGLPHKEDIPLVPEQVWSRDALEPISNLAATKHSKDQLVHQNPEISAPKLRFRLDISRYLSPSSSFFARNFGILSGREIGDRLSENKNSIKALSSLFDFSPRNTVTSFDSLQF